MIPDSKKESLIKALQGYGSLGSKIATYIALEGPIRFDEAALYFGRTEPQIKMAVTASLELAAKGVLIVPENQEPRSKDLPGQGILFPE